jgi:hypothetical protein
MKSALNPTTGVICTQGMIIELCWCMIYVDGLICV